MLDLGDTLADSDGAFAFARESVEALSGFHDADGEPVEHCLVSDFPLADPDTAEQVDRRFEEYLRLLDRFGLRDQFVPAERRVTLSTNVGVFKPDARVFTTALDRLGSSAALADSLFVTENADHLEACAALGMSVLGFGPGRAPPDGFDNWPDGIELIARTVAPDSVHNLELALSVLAKARLDLDQLHVVRVGGDDSVFATASRWTPLHNAELGDLDGVCVQLPVSLDVRDDAQGRARIEIIEEPSTEERAEAEGFVASLKAHEQIEGGAPSPISRATHYIDTDDSGLRKLKRRGYG